MATTRDPANFTYPFDEEKAAEAAVFFLEKQGTMGRFRLIKLLYLADRESIQLHGYPICGGTYSSMPHGPVISNVYDLIDERRAWTQSDGAWERFVRNDGKRCCAVAGISGEVLSRADLQVLEQVNAEFKEFSDPQLYDYVHTQLPEYEDPSGASAPIPPKRILRELGVDLEGIKAIGQQVEAERSHRNLMGG